MFGMQRAKEPRHRYRFAACCWALCCTRIARSYVRQREMCRVVAIRADGVFHQPLETWFKHNNYVAEQVAAPVTNQKFSNLILPGTVEADSVGLMSKPFPVCRLGIASQ